MSATVTIDTDQTATANICNLRFLGIVVVGTKLKEMSKQSPTPKPKERGDVLYVGMESRNGLGTFSGVVVSLDRQSLSLEADRVLVSFSFGFVGCVTAFRTRVGLQRMLTSNSYFVTDSHTDTIMFPHPAPPSASLPQALYLPLRNPTELQQA